MDNQTLEEWNDHVRDLDDLVRKAHALLSQKAESSARKLFDETIQPEMCRLALMTDELPNEVVNRINKIKYHSYLGLARYLNGAGLRGAGR